MVHMANIQEMHEGLIQKAEIDEERKKSSDDVYKT